MLQGGEKFTLSKQPYLNRAKTMEQAEQLKRGMAAMAVERKVVDVKGSNEAELENKLLAVCNNLQAKNLQCRFLLEQNEYLNQRLQQLSKNPPELPEVQVLSQTNLKNDKPCCQQLRQQLKQLTAIHQHKTHKISVPIQTSQKVISAQQSNTLQTKLLNTQAQIATQRQLYQQRLLQKDKVIEMLNGSLLGAIQTSSKLMAQKCELSQKLQQSATALKQIEALYINAKEFIFRGMDETIKSKQNSIRQQIEASQYDIFKQQLADKQRELQATKYLLNIKTKQCQDKQQAISDLQTIDNQVKRLKNQNAKLQSQTTKLRNQIKQLLSSKQQQEGVPDDRLMKALKTIQTQVSYCRKVFQYYWTLSRSLADNSSAGSSAIKRRYQQFKGSLSRQFEQICSTLILKKIQIDRFSKELYLQLSKNTQ